jgi:diguanylate cyclase (GGDEF)-like protein/PAS domain S-box-containing protein
VNVARLRILVVEDDLADQFAIRRMVRAANLPYDLTMVDSVAAARAALAVATFDAIVTDYSLGDGTALDVLAVARDVASIIVTGAGSQTQAAVGLRAGAADYLVKEHGHRHLDALPGALDRALRAKAQDRRVNMLAHALTHIGEAVYVSAPDDSILFVNRAFCEMYGWTEAEVLGRATTSLWPAPSGPISDPRDERSHDVRLDTSDGRTLTVALTRSRVHDEAGNVIAIVRVMRDVTERGQIERALRDANRALERSRAAFEELAMRDELTSLYNRRELERRLVAEIARSGRTNQPFSFVLFDLDHFKAVNDSYGHPAGDAVLRQVARLVERELRVSDVAARYGGEEIALLLPETSAEDAVLVASRLRARLAAERFDIGGGATISVTASFGVACMPPHATTTHALVAAADEALYEAKAAGRDRVVCRVRAEAA